MFRLEPFELVQQPIEGFVGDLGIVVNVVPLFVMADLGAELLDSGQGIHGRLG